MNLILFGGFRCLAVTVLIDPRLWPVDPSSGWVLILDIFLVLFKMTVLNSYFTWEYITHGK